MPEPMEGGRYLEPDPSVPLAGVRLARGGAVLFCDPGGHELAVSQVVVIGPSRPPADRAMLDEVLATVVFTPNQLLENEAGASASVRVLRLATPEDIILFGRREAQARGFTDRTRAVLAEADPGSLFADAWLSADQARFTVAVGRMDFDAGAVARRLEHELGLPVDLRRLDPDAAGSTGMTGLSGVLAAGLVPEWTDWLAGPGVEPMVRPPGSGDHITAREFIDRLFSPEERSAWERPRRPRS